MENKFADWKLSLLAECAEQIDILQQDRERMSLWIAERRRYYGIYEQYEWARRNKLDERIQNIRIVQQYHIPRLQIEDFLSISQDKLKWGPNRSLTLSSPKLDLDLPEIKSFIETLISSLTSA